MTIFLTIIYNSNWKKTNLTNIFEDLGDEKKYPSKWNINMWNSLVLFKEVFCEDELFITRLFNRDLNQ